VTEPTGKPTVVIVGVGILGSVLAEMLSDDFSVVAIDREPISPGPQSDSQRNHAWLQSGALYLDDPEVADSIAVSGRGLLRRFGQRPPLEGGIFAFADLSDVDEFIKWTTKFGYSAQVRRLDPAIARLRLGNAFDPNKVHFRVPDAPFDESGLVEIARSRAESNGALFKTVQFKLGFQENRAWIELADGVQLSPAAIILCAGSGTPGLLLGSGLEGFDDIEVDRSALLNVRFTAMPDCGLFVDRDSGLSIVQHGDVAVIGGRFRVRQGAEPSREVTEIERQKVLDLIPKKLRDEMKGLPQQWVGGLKTEIRGGGVSSMVRGPSEHDISNLVVSLPGKATLAFLTAQKIHTEIADMLAEESSEELVGSVLSVFQTIKNSIANHYETEYKDHNDAV
jgi:glycine/D-amino acid oxidase-like deaminating enzyme